MVSQRRWFFLALVFWIPNLASIFGPKKSKLFVLPKNGHKSMARMLILILTLIFSVFNLKSIFGQFWAGKVKIITFMILFSSDRLHYCDFGHFIPYVVFMFCELEFCELHFAWIISRIIILIPTLVFWISNPKSIFGEIWSEKVKAICFVWKLAHTEREERESI